MIPEQVLRPVPCPEGPARRAPGARVLAVAAAVVELGAAGSARAQADPAAGATERPAFVQVIERLDGSQIALLVLAVLVVLLLVWRVVAMVRRERPVPVARRRAKRDGDPLDLLTLQQTTDWGFDQNKRAAMARTPVAVEGATSDQPSREAVLQWSADDTRKALGSGVQPRDALGQSPVVGPPSSYRTSFGPYFRNEAPAVQVGVVGVADTLLQAELLVQLGDPKQAMWLLSRHIRETEPAPAVWLMLLGLYQSTGREAQYAALGAGFRMLFNCEVPAWATTDDAPPRELESYPQAMSKLQATWSGPQARTTIEALLNDDRGGSRQGFALAAYRELLFLADLLDTIDEIARDETERSEIQRKLGNVP